MTPSVTQIISPWSDFSMVPEHVLEAAGVRGTRVHKSCASIARGLWAPRPADISGYLLSYDQWFTLIDKDRPMWIEEEFISKIWGFIGHPDFVGFYRGDPGLVVVDNKTPRSLLKAWKAQLAAYAILVEEKTGIKVNRCGSLRLNPEGGRPIFDELSGKERIRATEAFIGALTAHKYFMAA